ncbi:MAG: 16S rRNA processing protein RimM [Brumimicrobium sp.]|nr:16S rRNA processing protein RimM [Brumimicrobium sp.]
MNKADCFNLGYVAKLHGFKGEVSLFFDTTNPYDYQEIEAVFIEKEGVLIPYFIDKLELNNKGFARVKFEDVDTEEEAKKLVKKPLFLPLSLLPELSGKNFYDHEIVGFVVFDINYGKVGEVDCVLDLPVNPLLQIINKEKNVEILLPLANNLVQSVDREKRELHVSAPEGLIEMYLD